MTELIQSAKNVDAAGRKMVIVTTTSGETIWVTQQQYNANAETISYTKRKAGEQYTNKKTGETGVLKANRNDLDGFGMQSKVENSKSLLDYVISKGITPTFALS